jgi:ABC-type multidrug transport system fused ATPase/permease subunit
MILNFVVSFMIVALLLVEVILPIILILILGFFLWRLIRKKWIDRIFASLVYERNPLVREFYKDVGRSVEEKGNKLAGPVAYIALILCIAGILKTLWPHVFYHGDTANLFLLDGLPWMFLYIGLIFFGFGVSSSIISSLLFIKEAKKIRVYNRSLEIFLLSKYLENILYITLGIALIIGVAYLWFFFLEKLVPAFRYFENESASFVELKVNYEEMLKTLRSLLISFRNQFQTWCVASFLISLVSFAVPYMWFKGRRFTTVFLALFLSGTAFSYFVSFLIKKFFTSELTLIFIAVWIFSALITYIVSHLVNTISLNQIYICKHCRAENGIHSKYCSACGKKLIPLPME